MTQTETKHIRFGHSPDPDDAFMFYAFEIESIPMRGFKVEHVIEDIEKLNQRALKDAELEVTAVSCHAYSYLSDKYAVLRSGASMGDKYGPILVSREETSQFKGKRIAIPGKLTSAYLEMQIYEPDFEPVFTPFDQILDVVKKGEADLGLVIHEGQITYDQYGLKKVLGLGEWWHEETNGLPLPLGVDVIRRDLGEETMKEFSALFRDSIQYALDNRKPALDYAMKYGRGLTDELNDRFVGMYVNQRTVDIGDEGEAAFRLLLDKAFEKKLIPNKPTIDFI